MIPIFLFLSAWSVGFAGWAFSGAWWIPNFGEWLRVMPEIVHLTTTHAAIVALLVAMPFCAFLAKPKWEPAPIKQRLLGFLSLMVLTPQFWGWMAYDSTEANRPPAFEIDREAADRLPAIHWITLESAEGFGPATVTAEPDAWLAYTYRTRYPGTAAALAGVFTGHHRVFDNTAPLLIKAPVVLWGNPGWNFWRHWWLDKGAREALNGKSWPTTAARNHWGIADHELLARASSIEGNAIIVLSGGHWPATADDVLRMIHEAEAYALERRQSGLSTILAPDHTAANLDEATLLAAIYGPVKKNEPRYDRLSTEIGCDAMNAIAGGVDRHKICRLTTTIGGT